MKGLSKGLIFVLLIMSCFAVVDASLGIAPSRKEINFVPNADLTFKYDILSDSPDSRIEIYAEGDLAKYVTMDKKEVIGGGSVLVRLKLPATIESPGVHTLLIGAREIPPETQFLSAAINIRAVIYVYVPYPGKYIESTISIPDVNEGKDIPVEIKVINRGKNDLSSVDVDVNFYDDSGAKAGEIGFENVGLLSGEERYFRKNFMNSGFKPGSYLAEAVINYDDTIGRVNSSFRVGHLFVAIKNFTNEIKSGGIQKFDVDIESNWNDVIRDVYADVYIDNGNYNTSLRTPSISLDSWQSARLEGFLDSDGLAGEYDVNVKLSYAGQTNSADGKLNVVKGISSTQYAVIAIIILLVAAIAVSVAKLLRKKRR